MGVIQLRSSLLNPFLDWINETMVNISCLPQINLIFY